MEEQISIPTIKLSDVEKVIASIKHNVGEYDTELSFEFILMTFFPTCWENIQDALKDQFTKGYIAGLKELKAGGCIEEDADCFCD